MEDDKIVKWITVKGNRIPIKEGQSAKEAIAERFDDTDDIEIEIETEDFDEDILNRDIYYFSGYNPHEVTKEEYEKNKKINPAYYDVMRLTSEEKDLFLEYLNDQSKIDNMSLGKLLDEFDNKLRYYEHGSIRKAINNKLKDALKHKYEIKAEKFLSKLPKLKDNDIDNSYKKANAEGYAQSLKAEYKSAERKKYTNNCQRCVIAYEMRRRGYDVEAAEWQNDGLGIGYRNLSKSFSDFKEENVHHYNNDKYGNKFSSRGALIRQMAKDMLEEPEGARFILNWDWKCFDAGHTVNAEKRNGTIEIYDAQNGKKYSIKDLIDRKDLRATTLEWIRTDNLLLSSNLEGVVKWKK